jgi:serine/threonine protein kinase
MEGSDSRLSVANCGGCARLAAVVGLAMLPIMDSIHRQRKAYTDMKPQNIALDAQGRPFLIDIGQLANQVRCVLRQLKQCLSL